MVKPERERWCQIGSASTAVTSIIPFAKFATAAKASPERRTSRISCRCSICKHTTNLSRHSTIIGCRNIPTKLTRRFSIDPNQRTGEAVSGRSRRGLRAAKEGTAKIRNG